MFVAAEGFGHDGKLHSAHFFELSNQPIEITMALSAADVERMLTRLREEGINVLFIKTPIEYGMSGEN